MNNNINDTVKWANNYIDWFNKNYDFDPFQVITGEMDKQHALYNECITLIATLEKVVDVFRENRDKIAR